MAMLAGGEGSHLAAVIRAKALFRATNNSSAPSHSSGLEEAFLRLLQDSPDSPDLCVSIVTYKYRPDATQAWIITTVLETVSRLDSFRTGPGSGLPRSTQMKLMSLLSLWRISLSLVFLMTMDRND